MFLSDRTGSRPLSGTNLLAAFKISLRTFSIVLILHSGFALGQGNKVKLVHANTLEDYPSVRNTTLAKGNIEFEYKNTRLFCDSALYFRDKEVIHAYGNVHINQGDTINIFGDSLKYYGRENLSKLAGHVRFRDNDYKMVTDSLDYDGDKSMATYRNNAVITSINGDLELKSRKGYYSTTSKTFYFKENVIAHHPEYHLTADTLEFRTIPQTAHFHGPTDINLIKGGQNVACSKGIYFSETGFMRLWDGAELRDSSQVIIADSLEYDQETDVGEGWRSVTIYDSIENVRFSAEYALKARNNENILLHGKAQIRQYNVTDTLFIQADTIFHQRDTLTEFEKSVANHHVVIIKADLYVRCDSAWFSESDSLAKLFKEPILWNNRTQLTADSIYADYFDKEFHRIKMYNNAMIVNDHKQDTAHYDQLKGKRMTAVLDSGAISRVFIELNAETLYYVVNAEKDSSGTETEEIDGMNKIDCNQITIYFANDEIDNIAFIDQPVSVYYPLNQIPANVQFLKGFVWKIAFRPNRLMFE